jgi:predicted Rossmann-fold nucleotide-binding protein
LWIWNGFVSQVGLLNVNGYYEPLLMLFEKALEVRYLNDAARLILVSAPTPKELINKMEVSKREMMVPLVANITKIKGKADHAIFLTTSYDIIFH